MVRSATEKAREMVRREVRSDPLEVQIDTMLRQQLKKRRRVLGRGADYFEIPDKLVMFYKYSYGMQSRFFKELKERKKLLGSMCRKCAMVYFPPRASCGECYTGTVWKEVSKEGLVLSSTTSWYSTSEFFHKVPYAIGYVKPLNADTAILQKIDLDGGEFVEPGTKVAAKFRRVREGVVSDFWYEVR